jgi:hypothetical protein
MLKGLNSDIMVLCSVLRRTLKQGELWQNHNTRLTGKKVGLGKLRAPLDGGYIPLKKSKSIITAMTFGDHTQKSGLRHGTTEELCMRDRLG